MNRPMYTKALRYAFMLMPYHENYYDLVHDAFLAYHKGTGLNLFDQEERTVIATVKNVWKNYISKNRYMYQGVNLQKVYTVYEDDLNSSGVDLHNQTQGDDSVVWLYNQAKKYYEVLSVVNPSNIKNYTDAFESTLDIVNLKHQGYSQKEISEKIGVSSTTIKKYMDKLKEIINETPETPFAYNSYNPFNGNKLKVDKTILNTTYSSHKDRYKDYVYDPDKGCDYNEYYRLLINKKDDTVLLIRNSQK